MSKYDFTIPAGLEVNQNVGFAPLAAYVSNYSPFYIFFPDGQNFVPPWTNGATVSLSHATQARASWLYTPFGPQVVVIPPDVVYTASIIFVDVDAASSGGTTIANPYSQLTIFGENINGHPAGALVLNTFAVGTLNSIESTSISGKVLSGTLGFLLLLLTDGTNDYVLDSTYLDDLGVTISKQSYSNFVPVRLDPTVPWTLQIVMADAVGVCSYYFNIGMASR